MEKNEIISELERLSKIIEELKLVSESKEPNALLWKRIEDGILDNLHNANPSQLRRLNTYSFKFYSELNNSDKLESLIKSKLREHRLKKLLDK